MNAQEKAKIIIDGFVEQLKTREGAEQFKQAMKDAIEYGKAFREAGKIKPEQSRDVIDI